MPGENSVTRWIDGLREGSDADVQRLWDRYFQRLVHLASARLPGHARRASDEEDVALSAFNSFCDRVGRGQFPELVDRDDLWRLLVTITTRKVVESVRRETRKKRGGGRVRGASAFADGDAIDQGMAQVLSREPAPVETAAGSAVGTPSYMGPEQAEGRLDRLGPATDVYGLGATLYHLLTGRPPLRGDDAGEVLRKVARGEFPRPRSIDWRVPGGLEAACLKAMKRRPEDRNQSAKALGDDVERWLADDQILASLWTLLPREDPDGRRRISPRGEGPSKLEKGIARAREALALYGSPDDQAAVREPRDLEPEKATRLRSQAAETLFLLALAEERMGQARPEDQQAASRVQACRLLDSVEALGISKRHCFTNTVPSSASSSAGSPKPKSIDALPKKRPPRRFWTTI